MTDTEPPADVRRILVATDFSATAEGAVEWAATIASRSGAALHLVHALHLHGAIHDYLPSPPDVETALTVLAQERLEETSNALLERGIQVASILAVGLPSEAILETARQLRPDLLVVGTSGQGGVLRLLGSTAQRVAQGAPCPVLSVPPGEQHARRPIHTIVVPTDFSRDASAAAAAAQRLLENLEDGAEMVLLHAYHLPVEYTAYGAVPTAFHFRPDLVSVAEQRLAEIATPLERRGLRIVREVREGYPPQVIVEVARERGADVIAMGTHGRSGLRHLLLGSNAERVIAAAPCPVLTVRHPEADG